MSKSVYNISLDLHRTDIQVSVSARVGETNRRLRVRLVEDGKPYEISYGAYAVFAGTKADGTTLYNDCTIEDGVIIYDFTEQTSAAVGVLEAQILLYGIDGGLICSPWVAVVIYKPKFNVEAVTSSSEFEALRQLYKDFYEYTNNQKINMWISHVRLDLLSIDENEKISLGKGDWYDPKNRGLNFNLGDIVMDGRYFSKVIGWEGDTAENPETLYLSPPQLLGGAAIMVQSTGDSTDKVMSQKATTDELNGLKQGGVNDRSLTAAKQAWLKPNGTSTYEETTSLFDDLVNGIVLADGTVNTSSGYRRTDYIDITAVDSVQVKIKSFTPDPARADERMVWIGRFDKDKTFIAREPFMMYPLTEEGNINVMNEEDVPNSVSYPISDAVQINTKEFYQYGMGKSFSSSDYDDGTVYVIVFNFRAADVVDMTIEGISEKTIVDGYCVPKNMLPSSVLNDIEALKKNQNPTIADDSVTTAKLANNAVTTDKVTDGAITKDKLSAEVAEKLNATNEGAEGNTAEDGIVLSEYVEPLIDNIALAAKAHMKEDSLCVVLFADTHYEAHHTCFPTLIAKKLAQATNASAILHLGDLAHLYTEDRATGLAVFQRHSKILQGTKIPYLQVVGNHDDGQMYLHHYTNDYSAENYIKAYEMYHATTKQSRNYITLGSVNGWYYMDDEDSKTRLIVLNSHEYPWVVNEDGTLAYDSNAKDSISCIYSTEQIEWLANTALNFADKGDVTEQAKWSVLAFAHMGTTNWTAINSLFTAFWAGTKKTSFSSSQTDTFGLYDYSGITITNDFSLVGGRKIAFFMGDIHKDKVSGGNYPLITFLDCKLETTKLGTVNESALSVLVVTPSEGKITELRFGEGTKTVDGVEVAHDPLTDYDNYRVIDF